MSAHAKAISVVRNGTLCNIHLWAHGLCLCRCQRACSQTQQTAQPLGSPVWSSSSSGNKQSRGVTYSNVLPLTVRCSLCICIQIKTMASTSSVSQVSAWTWSWDNLPRSSFLVHQMRASVCLSLVSFTFSHLLLTFIIQIRMSSRKTDGRIDGWCRCPCSPCASPWATTRQPIAFEGLYIS